MTDKRVVTCCVTGVFVVLWNPIQLTMLSRAATVAEYSANAGSVISGPGARWAAQYTSPAYGNLAFPVEDDLGTGINAWQIADQSATLTNPRYGTALTAAESLAAATSGWRLTSTARYVFDFGDAASFGFGADVGGRSYELRLDLNSTGDLQATLADESTRTFVLTSGATGPLAYHDFALEYSPASGLTSFRFDNTLLDSWNGIPTVATDAVQWGNADGPNRGIMNYHSVRFETAPFSTPIAGDYEKDGDVDGSDYSVWRRTFGSTTSLSADGNGNSIVDAADYVVWRNSISSTVLAGDYNADGTVNNSDYTLWRSAFGSTSALASDGNHNSVVDAADYVVWRKSSSSGGAMGQAISVPEPAWRPCLFMVVSIAWIRRSSFGRR